MDLQKYHHIYMIGIGGVSMSGIAEILTTWGYKVSGSDQMESKQTLQLMAHNIEVKIGQKEENITQDLDLIVYTAAIKEDNPEYKKAKDLGIPLVERGVFLGELTKLFKDSIGIAGTHGKTTTTSMVASIFLEAKLDPTIQVGAFLDRIEGNYRIGKSDYFIIEACEYCDSYLNFHLRSSIVLNIDNDHLDYFKNIDNIEHSFQKYVAGLPNDGYLVLNADDERCLKLKNYTKAKVITVGKKNASWTYDNVSYDDNGYPLFDVYHENNFIDRISLGVTGDYNIMNSLCALALCEAYGLKITDIKKALNNFHGASRRLEYKGLFHGAFVYDDYGHHPTEIKATSLGLKKKKYHESWVVFEPHTYSRLQAHLDAFADVLTTFDHIIITDIYAAREKNTFQITVEDLIAKIEAKGHQAIHLSDYEKIKEYLSQNVQVTDIILTLGAGTVTKLADSLT